MCGGGAAGGADGVSLASVKQRLQAADAALQAHQSKRELYASELQRALQNPTLQSTIVPVCEKELQACEAAVAAARDAKRKVEELHGAVVARDAQAVKVRKTEAGRAAATKSSATAQADAERAAEVAQRAAEKAARLAAKVTALDLLLALTLTRTLTRTLTLDRNTTFSYY